MGGLKTRRQLQRSGNCFSRRCIYPPTGSGRWDTQVPLLLLLLSLPSRQSLSCLLEPLHRADEINSSLGQKEGRKASDACRPYSPAVGDPLLRFGTICVYRGSPGSRGPVLRAPAGAARDSSGAACPRQRHLSAELPEHQPVGYGAVKP